MDTAMMDKDMSYMLEKAVILKKSAFDFAKDIEQYVNPESRKPWDWSKVYPGTRKQIDFNAQRFARTSINHAYWLSNTRSCSKNPFATVMRWELSNSHYERQVLPFGEDICDELARQNWYRLGTGNFPVNEVPIPHPMCLCVQYAVIPKSMEDIGKELRAWTQGEPNPLLDEWYDVNVKNPEKAKYQRPDLRSAAWMARQPEALKEYYLGGKNKRILFDAGVLSEKDFGKNLHKLQEDGIILIQKSKIRHSTIGDFGTVSGRMTGGGHGQANIEELNRRGIEYTISKTYSNEVRVGNVERHTTNWKASGNGQSWFPINWDEDKIHAAGTFVANKGAQEGNHMYGIYENVKVGVILETDGKVGSVFPDVIQSHLREGD